MWFDIVEFWFGIGDGQILSIFDIFIRAQLFKANDVVS